MDCPGKEDKHIGKRLMNYFTKANTLKKLEERSNGDTELFRVLPMLIFTADELMNSPEKIEKQVDEQFSCPLIVRSSALNEDTENSSNAGVYLSITKVMPDSIIEAATKVIDSYSDKNPENQVLIQPMLENIYMSGVLFTADPNTGGNYIVINYDDSGESDVVTSGLDSKHIMIFKGHKTGNIKFDNLIDASNRICNILSQENLDIEFAFTEDSDIPYIFQARPLVIKKEQASMQQQAEDLSRLEKFIHTEMKAKPYAKGSRTIYGVMPDWNPAEMIGIRPKPLAFTLYKQLITDRNWAYQRDNYGYYNMRGYPLMLDFLGLPYIDTRVSFNSFVPKDIDDMLAEKLVNYYLDSLANNPNNHDKVEFEIVFSCYSFDIQERSKILQSNGFSNDNINNLLEALRVLTNRIINVKDGLWLIDEAKIKKLQERQKIVMDSDMDTVSKIYWLLEDCARYGTLPFAGLARAGFIAVQLLKSLVAIGILSTTDYGNYMQGLFTISNQISSNQKDMSKADFMSEYGHLRPGTYDITSPRYDAAPELYFSSKDNNVSSKSADSIIPKDSGFSLSLKQYEEIKEALVSHGLGDDPLALFSFIKAGIEGREQCKFVFSKSLSDAIELIAQLGESEGFSREDMSYMDISVIDRLFSSADSTKKVIAESIKAGRLKYEKTIQYSMPPVIMSPSDIYCFELPSGSPNYITMSNVAGSIITEGFNANSVSGHIILIESADPGFDWVFSCGIVGIITVYGGANSHMAIRAGELNIPSIIGIGEKMFNRLKDAKMLHIDCANRKVEILQ